MTWFLVFALGWLQQGQPTFRSGVELISIDVHATDRSGRPVVDLTAADFEVHVGGERRKVVSAQLISYGAAAPSTNRPATAEVSGAEAPRPRRMYVLAVDEHSLHVSNAMAAVRAAERFIDALEPDDLVGLYAYPTGAAYHDLTNDHRAVRRELQKVGGVFVERPGKFNLTVSEAIDIANRDNAVVREVLRRECGGRSSPGCSPRDIDAEGTAQAAYIEMQASQSLGGLRGLVRGLAKISGRKNLVLVSGGLITTDQAGGRADTSSEISSLAREAALANLAVFALHLDWSFITSATSRSGLRTTLFRDGDLAAGGLERIAGSTGGTMLRVYGTAPEKAFDRVLLETSAYYLLGVESAETDRDGNPKGIRVNTKRRGVQLRSRPIVVIPKK
jgi:VWFA-related protein